MAWADMFMSYMYCFVVRNIPLHIDYWWQDLSPLRLSGKLRGRRSYDVFFRYSKFTHARETKVLSFWRGSSLVSLDDVTRQPPVCPVAGVTSGWQHFRFYPFLWTYCDKIVFSYFMCTLSQTLFLSTSLLLGSFRYVFNSITVLTCIVSICRF